MTNDNGNPDENNSIERYLESVWRSVTHTLENFKVIEIIGGLIAIIYISTFTLPTRAN